MWTLVRRQSSPVFIHATSGIALILRKISKTVALCHQSFCFQLYHAWWIKFHIVLSALDVQTVLLNLATPLSLTKEVWECSSNTDHTQQHCRTWTIWYLSLSTRDQSVALSCWSRLTVGWLRMCSALDATRHPDRNESFRSQTSMDSLYMEIEVLKGISTTSRQLDFG